MGGMTQPPIMIEEKCTLSDLAAARNRRKRQAAHQGSEMASGLGSSGLGLMWIGFGGLGSDMLSESGSEIDALTLIK